MFLVESQRAYFKETKIYCQSANRKETVIGKRVIFRFNFLLFFCRWRRLCLIA